MRAAAREALQKLIQEKDTNVLDWRDIDRGFTVDGRKIHFASKALGIFKPKEFADGAALSIKQVTPSRTGRTAPYDDRDVGSGMVIYRLQRDGQSNNSNQTLETAWRLRVPLIFFRGVADGRYEAIYPVFVDGLSYEKGAAVIVFDQPAQAPVVTPGIVSEPIEVRYGLAVQKVRLHQQAFRRHVLLAYGLRCALTHLPLVDLLQAAHIIPDSAGGEASVRNGIAMSAFHHVAYESNLMGIDPDGKIHLSDRVSEVRDGPMFDHGMLRLEGVSMRMPVFDGHRPSRDFLAQRFEEFRRAG